MTTERDVDLIVKTWLETGATRLPDRVLENVLDRLPATPQSRPMWPVLRRRPALTPLRTVLAAATLGLVAVVGVGLLTGDQDRRPVVPPSSSPMASPVETPSPSRLSLEPPADVNAYVASAYDGLVDLPALSATVVEVDGTKERYAYDGTGLVRNDHFDNATNSVPSSYRILSRDTMSEESDLDGTPVWLGSGHQGHPLLALAYGAGLQRVCGAGWTYVALEYLIDRPTHHVACGDSQMWLDVETRLALRSINVQPADIGPTVEFAVTELTVGPQPAELFQPPAGVRVLTEAEFACASDPACQSAAPEPTSRPVITPAPAEAGGPVPADLDAFVAEVLARYSTPPALDMLVDDDGFQTRFLSDGHGRSRTDYGPDPTDTQAADILVASGHTYQSHPQDDGTVVWEDLGPAVGGGIPDLGLAATCPTGWEHRGYGLILGRPAHHLVCGLSESWIDRDSLLVMRQQRNPGPLEYDTHVQQVLELELTPPPAELFEAPASEDILDASCFSRERLTCERSPGGASPFATSGNGPGLSWTSITQDATAVAWLGDRFILANADAHTAATSADGLAWHPLDAGDLDWDYADLMTELPSVSGWQHGMVGFAPNKPDVVRIVWPPGDPVAKTDFGGKVGAIGIGPKGIVARIHSGIDFDAFVASVLGPDWVGRIKTFEYRDGVLHIATEDGRVADIVMADHGLGAGDVAGRGYGWLSAAGRSWTSIPDFPAGVTDIVGVVDGFIARGDTGMWHSPDGLSWHQIGEWTEGTLIPWGDGALLSAPGGELQLWTADGVSSLPMTVGLPAGPTRANPPVGAGPMGIVSIGTTNAVFSPDGETWNMARLPEEMYASGGGRRPPTIAVGDDEVLVLMWSGGARSVPTLWRGAPAP